jgi:hypothetical protein
MALPRTPPHRPPPSPRGHVSPLGGQVFSEVRNDLQSKQEARNRAQSRRPADLIPPGPRGREPQR